MTTPARDPAGLNDAAVAIGGAVVLLALTPFVIRRRPRRAGDRRRGRQPSAESTQELAAAAAAALVMTDDAVRTSDQELGFATARCGKRATAPFSAALRAARTELATAFTLRQRLDDGEPLSQAKARATLSAISVHCTEANRLLDEQSEAFDRLQDLAARAPRLAAEIEAHIAQQSARVGAARQILDRLTAKYGAEAVAIVAGNPRDALERLDFASDSLASAGAELAAGQAGRAVVLLQAAEASADEAVDLLDGVKHMEAELTQAASGLAAALREIDAEISEATEVLPGGPASAPAELGRLVAQAQAVAADVRARQAAGPFDALGALREVQQADSALDRALASGREEQDRRERARAVLDQAMLVARSSVVAAGDFIATRRGGVGATARTRLAEGQRHFEQAIGSAQHDPETALTEAQHADALALQARELAEQDVAEFDNGELGAAVGTTGVGTTGAGTAGAGAASVDTTGVGTTGVDTTGGVRGAILGGTLIGSLSGGLGPASFGGAGTRGRRSLEATHSLMV